MSNPGLEGYGKPLPRISFEEVKWEVAVAFTIRRGECGAFNAYKQGFLTISPRHGVQTNGRRAKHRNDVDRQEPPPMPIVQVAPAAMGGGDGGRHRWPDQVALPLRTLSWDSFHPVRKSGFRRGSTYGGRQSPVRLPPYRERGQEQQGRGVGPDGVLIGRSSGLGSKREERRKRAEERESTYRLKGGQGTTAPLVFRASTRIEPRNALTAIEENPVRPVSEIPSGPKAL